MNIIKNKRLENIQIIEGRGKDCLVSDAGLPTISDPGYELVAEAIAEQLTVVPLPGANAALQP